MPKVRVPVSGTVGKTVLIETDAAVIAAAAAGATIGLDLKLPDGTTPSLSELALALSLESAQAEQWPFTFWNRILEVPAVLASLATLVDPNENQVLYWDDTANALDFADNLVIDEAANLVSIRTGNTLRVLDAANTNGLDISSDGTDINLAAVGAIVDINIGGQTGAVVIATTGVGDIFAVRTAAGNDVIRIDDTGIDFGLNGRRIQRMEQPDSTGRIGTELWPDDYTVTTATGNSAAFFTQASRTITLNIPGGGGVGNDTAPGGMNFSHTVRFEDTGFLFAAQLLINAAVQVECATPTVGPLYLFLDQYRTYADTVAATCTQHNTIRAQPRWGANINGGSITQTSAELYFASATVDATVGSASVTTLSYFAPKNPTLTAGGTIGTLNVMDIPNISGPTTIRGINSAMANGFFIFHTGLAPSFHAGEFRIGDSGFLRLGGSPGNAIQLSRVSAGVLRMIGAGGTNNEGLDWDFDTATANDIRLSSPTGAGLTIDVVEVAFGTMATGGANNWQILEGFGAKTITLGGDFSRHLFSASANVVVDAALTTLSSFTINEPGITLGTGSVVDAANVIVQTAPSIGTNRYGLLITSNPAGGTLNYALRVTNGDVRFDARTDINNPIALGGGVAPTLGTIGGTGPTAAAQAQWVEIDIGGVPHWIPVWV